jgi:hypothetical protein
MKYISPKSSSIIPAYWNSCCSSSSSGLPNPSIVNHQKRVIYVGYWLSDNDITNLVNQWKSANITHILLTFITQPDITKPLSDAFSMTQAFFQLSTANQNLLTSNFVIGVSYGGQAAMPSPYSKTFTPGSYYYNNPSLLANDLVQLCGPLNKYYDLDIEYIDNEFQQCADFIGNICIALKTLIPSCVISHAPQTPYFTPHYGNVYNIIYNQYSSYFNWFNIQYYNNGPSDTYEQIFLRSDDGYSAVLELINSGINANYIVVGKPVNSSEGESGGYVPLNILVGYIQQAFGNPYLIDWQKGGGEMIWYYNTQISNGNTSTIVVPSINKNFKIASFTNSDNDSIISFFQQVSILNPFSI